MSELSVKERLEAMISKYSEWAETGVPEGVDFKKSLTAAHNWSCPEHGIFAVSSKRDWNRKSVEYGKMIIKIDKLLKRLKPFAVVQEEKAVAEGKVPGKKRRSYTTQKARRVAAEDEIDVLTGMLEATSKKYHEQGRRLERAEIDLASQKARLADLEQRHSAMSAENAQLKRLIAGKAGLLQLVE